jgi:Rrf2 family cysteine metabolism transcriptional repressor
LYKYTLVKIGAKMRLTAKSSYALNIVGYLAEQHIKKNEEINRTSAKDIATAYGLSESFVTSILRELRLSDITTAKKGPSGGYTLSRGPEEISIGDVFKAISEDPITYQTELFSNPVSVKVLEGLDENINEYLNKRISEFM